MSLKYKKYFPGNLVQQFLDNLSGSIYSIFNTGCINLFTLTAYHTCHKIGTIPFLPDDCLKTAESVANSVEASLIYKPAEEEMYICDLEYQSSP